MSGGTLRLEDKKECVFNICGKCKGTSVAQAVKLLKLPRSSYDYKKKEEPLADKRLRAEMRMLCEKKRRFWAKISPCKAVCYGFSFKSQKDRETVQGGGSSNYQKKDKKEEKHFKEAFA